jgi:hypothetical protein
MNTSSGIMSDLNSLPGDVLKLIMHHVPVVDRLTSCCLVSSRLHAAAVAATDALTLGWRDYVSPHLNVRVRTHDRAHAALKWLASYGQQVTSLQFDAFPKTLQQLPCPRLLELKVDYRCSVQLGPKATPHPGVIPGCANLTKLELLCNVLDSSGAGAELCGHLSSLVHLQHLEVHLRDEQNDKYDIKGLSSGTLPSLKHLTYLDVYDLSVENIYELGALTNLQQLCLKAEPDVFVGPSSVPGLVLPAALTQLQLWSPVEAEILSSVPSGLKDLALGCAVDGPAEGPGSLLSCIAQLSCLTEFHLSVGLDEAEWPPSGTAYSSLTASSNLVDLTLSGAALPVGIWPFVFPAARTLPYLTRLNVDYEDSVEDPALPAAWGAADVACLVKCCPNLRKIDEVAMQHGSHVSQLHKLSALTSLWLNYSRADGPALEATMQGLAAVAQLQDLSVNLNCCKVGAAALLPLTRLTALSWITCNLYPSDSSDEDDDIDNPVIEVYLNQVSNLACSNFKLHSNMHGQPRQLIVE